MRKPQVQAELRKLAEEHNLPRLNELANELSNRRPVRRAPTACRRMTDGLRQEVRDFADANPEMTYTNIAQHFNINIGRVSETLAGKRA